MRMYGRAVCLWCSRNSRMETSLRTSPVGLFLQIVSRASQIVLAVEHQALAHESLGKIIAI